MRVEGAETMTDPAQNPVTTWAIAIEPVLNRWKSILGALVVILGALYSGYAFASSQFDNAVNKRIDTKVNIILAGLAEKKDFDGLQRRFNGVQDKVNETARDSSDIKRTIQHIERTQDERAKSIDKRLDLIIKLIEQRQ